MSREYNYINKYGSESYKGQMYEYLEHLKAKPQKNQVEKDEEILDKMEIKHIENYLRKKKLKNISR